MQIIRPGKLPENHNQYRGTCKLCRCEVVADLSEVLSGYSGMDAQHGHYVLCPTEGCNRQINMEKIVYR